MGWVGWIGFPLTTTTTEKSTPGVLCFSYERSMMVGYRNEVVLLVPKGFYSALPTSSNYFLCKVRIINHEEH